MPADQAKQKPRRVYIRENQLLLLVEHPLGLTSEEVARRLRQVLGDDQGQRELAALVDGQKLSAERTQTFRHLDRAAIEKLELPPHRRPAQEAFSLVFGPTRDQLQSKKLLRRIEQLNERLASDLGLPLGEDLVLRALAPNWLTTPAPEVAGTGGPGTRPVPTEGDPLPPEFHGLTVGSDDLATTPFGFRFGNTPGLGRPLATEETRPVEVVILDTAPSPDLVARAQGWAARHPLLRSLITQGRLAITYHNPAWDSAVPEPDRLWVRDHDYRMSDHGLFVAGIIHTLAPTARLRLIEVLDPYGVGDIEGIAQALRALADERASAENPPALIVNCSLTIVAPLAGHWRESAQVEDDLEEMTVARTTQNLDEKAPGDLTPAERDILAQLDLLSTALEWVFMALRNDDVLVVAAAGNDARMESYAGKRPAHARRPQARCPAAFATVVGVGALEESGNSAPYSNRADRQPRQGLATFGGGEEIVTVGARGVGRPRLLRKARAGAALLGCYLDDLPADADEATLANTNGWAWWSGSSFAAPIISGAIAWLVGAGAPTLDDAHAQLLGANDGLTTDQDERLLAHQGM